MKGFFTKKSHDSKKEPSNSPKIECNTVIKRPSSRHVKSQTLEQLDTHQLDCICLIVHHFESPENLILTRAQSRDEGEADLDAVNKKSLSSNEKCWLTKERILRYLRSTSWDTKKTIERIENTITWRREFGLSENSDGACDISAFAEVAKTENKTGKMYLLGYDRQQRPILHIKTGRQNTQTSFAQIQHLIYMIESAEVMMPPGVDTLTVLLDFKNYNDLTPPLARMPPISISKQVLHIIQEHYPGNLGRAVLSNIPWYCWNFIKIFQPFVDPITRSKLIYEEPFDTYIEQSQLETLHNGRLEFVYSNDTYLDDLARCVTKRKAQMFQAFLDHGGNVGVSEDDLKQHLSTDHAS
ncbi:LAFA_0G02476g1_1 [Lachancea sp. 'fantastica']|nr:LAFA_0G02476g1_1 [Lachancea sp. 'fantastica']